MRTFNYTMLCCMMAFVAIMARAEDNPEAVLKRADRLVSLRDRIVSEYSAWSLEYAKEDTQFAKLQRANYEQFGKRVEVKAVPAVVPTGRPSLQIRFVSMSGIKMPSSERVSKKTVLDLSSGQVHEGPDTTTLKQESSDNGTSLTSLLARDVQKSGDMALLENSFLIPAGRYAKLGDGNLQYYSGVDLSDRVQEHDPTCIVRKGEVLVIETLQKKYALVQYLGKYQEEVLLSVAYQPDGSAIFEFGALSRPKELNYAEAASNPQDLAAAMFVHNREAFFWKEVRTLAESLKSVAKNVQLTEHQQQQAKQIKKKLGIAE